MYGNYFTCRHQVTMSLYIHHMNSLQSIMWGGALVHIHFTLQAYAPKQICSPHWTWMSHCTSTVAYIQTPHYCTHPSEIIKLQQFIYHTTAKYVPAMNMPLKCHNYLTCINAGSMPIYMPCMNSLALTKWPDALYTDYNVAWKWCYNPITYTELASGPNQLKEQVLNLTANPTIIYKWNKNKFWNFTWNSNLPASQDNWPQWSLWTFARTLINTRQSSFHDAIKVVKTTISNKSAVRLLYYTTKYSTKHRSMKVKNINQIFNFDKLIKCFIHVYWYCTWSTAQ